MVTRQLRIVVAAAFALGGCSTSQSRPATPAPQPQQAEAPHTAPLDASQAERLQRLMLPLVQHMDHPMSLNQVKMTVMVDPHINAANGGGGDFYVTTGLLRKASDDELRAIMAHEVAHADLGHVAKAQTLAQNQQSLQYVSPDAVKGGLAGAAKAAGKEVAAPADAAPAARAGQTAPRKAGPAAP